MAHDKRSERETEIERIRLEIAVLRAEKLRNDLLALERRARVQVFAGPQSAHKPKENHPEQPQKPLLLQSPIEAKPEAVEPAPELPNGLRLEDVMAKLANSKAASSPKG